MEPGSFEIQVNPVRCFRDCRLTAHARGLLAVFVVLLLAPVSARADAGDAVAGFNLLCLFTLVPAFLAGAFVPRGPRSTGQRVFYGTAGLVFGFAAMVAWTLTVVVRLPSLDNYGHEWDGVLLGSVPAAGILAAGVSAWLLSRNSGDAPGGIVKAGRRLEKDDDLVAGPGFRERGVFGAAQEPAAPYGLLTSRRRLLPRGSAPSHCAHPA
jgi:hypothetical protein